MNTNKIIKKIKTEQQGAIKEAWKNHKGELKNIDKKITLKDLAEVLHTMDWYDMENVAYYAGYINGLEIAKEYIKEQAKNEIKL